MFDPTLVIPTGNVVSMFFVLVAAFVVRAGWRARLLAVGLAIAAAVLTALLPAAWLPGEPRLAFLLGFLPPLCAAVLVLRWARAPVGGAATPSPRPPP